MVDTKLRIQRLKEAREAIPAFRDRIAVIKGTAHKPEQEIVEIVLRLDIVSADLVLNTVSGSLFNQLKSLGVMIDPFERAPSARKGFDFIKAEVAKTGKVPSYARVAEHMKWNSASSARDLFDKLVNFYKVMNVTTDPIRAVESGHGRRSVRHDPSPAQGMG